MAPIGGGVLLKEVHTWGQALRIYILDPLPVLCLSAFLCVGEDVTGQLAAPASLLSLLADTPSLLQ